MVSICIPYINRASEQTNWDYLLSNFQVDKIFIKGKDGDEVYHSNVFGQGEFITEYSQLPKNTTKVLLNPDNAKYLKGEFNLIDFSHPEDVVYIVGPNNVPLSLEDFEDCDLDYIVFIPTDTKDDMFNWVAAVVTLYDRKVKNG